MSSASSARARRIDIAGERRPWTSTPIAMSGADRVPNGGDDRRSRGESSTEESTGSVGSSGATLSAVKPESAIRRRALGVLSGVCTARAVRVETNPVAARAAEQCVDGQPGDLARDVPERLLDPADRGHEHRAAAPERVPVHDLPEMLDPARVLALDQSGELCHRGHDRLCLALERRLARARRLPRRSVPGRAPSCACRRRRRVSRRR